MYIQEIIIDGFKSYAQKTVVSGFDPQFNAITGLNGTGKSNILDSICFVLGISNLTQVRVGNLQELVYKQGQAGVTKASVTIIFNNSDVSSSPVGYESHKQITVTRQVVIGGKNKYMINGHTVQQNQVQNMFHSVQLNVNNPHFLIMQGRITKVLNMKPMETLSMIEEAAGTRMFETKKQAAIKTIEKKQLKVDEITKCIAEEITPTLEGLRNERKDYHIWQANNIEYERLERFLVAYQYQDAQEKVVSAETGRQQLVDEYDVLMKSQEELNANAEVCASKISEIERLRADEMEGEFQKLKLVETELSKELVKTNALYANEKESIVTEKDSFASLVKQFDTLNIQIDEKSKEIDSFSKQLEAKETQVQTSENHYMNMREKYQNACAGVTDETSAELLSIPEQVGSWEKRDREAQSTIQQCQQRATYVKTQLKELQKTTNNQSKDNVTILKDIEQLQAKINENEKKMNQIKNQDPSLLKIDEGALRNQYHTLQSSVAQLKDTVDNLTISLEARLKFEFRDPEKGFDRTKVKGLVARLIKIKQSETATALEIVAGSKLYQVVVDTEQTGKLLLENGQLRKRVTILPLNKINARCTETMKVQKAKKLASSMGGTAQLALELVGYDEEVLKAMEYAFGSSIICNNSDIARAITYDKDIKTRTVTLDGDSYDPAGTLTGGSKNQLGVLLGKIDELTRASLALQEKEDQFNKISKQLSAFDKQTIALKDIMNDTEMKKHALKICEEKMADSSYSQTMNQINDYEMQLVSIDKEINTAKEQQVNAKEQLQKLKNVEKDNKKRREAVMKDMEKSVKDCQKAANTMRNELVTMKNRKDILTAEIKALNVDLITVKEQKSISESAIIRLTDELDRLSIQLSQIKSNFESAKQATTMKHQEMNRCSKEIKDLEREKEKYLKDSQHANLESRKVSHKLQKYEKDSKDVMKLVQNLLKQHPWIDKEKEFFGQEGSDFDFKVKDYNESMKRHKEIKTEQDRLTKKINKKVMGMIENAETEYEELNRKKEVILNDKAKIEAVIEELDVKKTQALQTTWSKVNKDFGSIFSMLLPGVTAKLEPLEGMTVSEGLEVKVAFNNVWKDSLTELSGGQRSLLALSLILSLLLFKPAPMYILDEVDAALDLSHTQNIGMMLRTHFSTSQFIVVSLKEGMFNNANVIFRTKFVDGISAVTRTVAGSKFKNTNVTNLLLSNSTATNNLQSNDNDEGGEDAPKKKKGKSVSTNKLNNATAIIDI